VNRDGLLRLVDQTLLAVVHGVLRPRVTHSRFACKQRGEVAAELLVRVGVARRFVLRFCAGHTFSGISRTDSGGQLFNMAMAPGNRPIDIRRVPTRPAASANRIDIPMEYINGILECATRVSRVNNPAGAVATNVHAMASGVLESGDLSPLAIAYLCTAIPREIRETAIAMFNQSTYIAAKARGTRDVLAAKTMATIAQLLDSAATEIMLLYVTNHGAQRVLPAKPPRPMRIDRIQTAMLDVADGRVDPSALVFQNPVRPPAKEARQPVTAMDALAILGIESEEGSDPDAETPSPPEPRASVAQKRPRPPPEPPKKLKKLLRPKREKKSVLSSSASEVSEEEEDEQAELTLPEPAPKRRRRASESDDSEDEKAVLEVMRKSLTQAAAYDPRA
jgi:hypothetical protein